MSIKEEKSKVKSLLIDVLNYPNIFPFYKDVRFVENRVYQITANMFGPFFAELGVRYTWYSMFVLDNTGFTMISHELSPKAPIKKMTAYWAVTNKEDGCEILLEHKFSVFRMPPIIKNVVIQIIKLGIRINSKKLLFSISRTV